MTTKEVNIKDINVNNNEKTNKEIKKLKKELKNCRLVNKELESVKKYYNQITSSPKKDLTSFQSQIYFLIPYKPMNSQDIHSYIRDVAFKNISYKNISNILRGLERKGYLEVKENNGDNKDILWSKIDKK